MKPPRVAWALVEAGEIVAWANYRVKRAADETWVRYVLAPKRKAKKRGRR